ncbi:NADH-quinone oxidoreductase subunit J [Candidatus Purcelliella pentastirinorum]|uniref:NADH-quinone oxidoreductase subunit J n=2 Tax=Candidatus Purcelliella pentastirinorum TaxID=472834 RepID=A0AAX3N749_9ENTR|nr:NADH-quinone oxidoreductase subunit J [Candidatus Purcelliella pentastirinorum]WDI78362.1 NADH-quinone oxidoreductase subunit J [Candidatus Purcelliella pentastirinorum]
MKIIFYICLLVIVINIICTIMNTNPINSLIHLIISLMSISGLFFLINAKFIGAIEVIVYAGAIMVLFIFVIMMLNLDKITKKREKKWSSNKLMTIILISLSISIIFIINKLLNNKNYYIDIIKTNIQDIGIIFFNKYILIVELSSIMLLSALLVSLYINNEH